MGCTKTTMLRVLWLLILPLAVLLAGCATAGQSDPAVEQAAQTEPDASADSGAQTDTAEADPPADQADTTDTADQANTADTANQAAIPDTEPAEPQPVPRQEIGEAESQTEESALLDTTVSSTPAQPLAAAVQASREANDIDDVFAEIDLPAPELPAPRPGREDQQGAADLQTLPEPEVPRAESAQAPANKPVPSEAVTGTAGSTSDTRAQRTTAEPRPGQPAVADLHDPPPAMDSDAPDMTVTGGAEAPFSVVLPGRSWIYLGEHNGNREVSFESRNAQGEDTVFTFRVDQPGTFYLGFQRQDLTRGVTERMLTQADISPAEESSVQPESSASNPPAEDNPRDGSVSVAPDPDPDPDPDSDPEPEPESSVESSPGLETPPAAREMSPPLIWRVQWTLRTLLLSIEPYAVRNLLK
ncbi:MAG: hypothetical protein ACOC0D_02650 [Spirochaeta sp.]